MTQLKPFDDLYAVPPGQVPEGYKELFTTESATEQDWAGVIPGKYDDILAMTGEEAVWYPDYENPILSINMALESGLSLLAANGLEGNYAIVKRCEMG